MSNEPSNTLGRLIAAERNALAALEQAQQAIKLAGSLDGRVQAKEQKIAQLEQHIASLNGRLAAMMGSGATQRG